jgi:hypothetical protein
LWKTDPAKAGEDPFLKILNSGDGFETLAAGRMALLHGISIVCLKLIIDFTQYYPENERLKQASVSI